jgi:hypothetical protein
MSKISLANITLDSADFRAHSDFYVKLLEGEIVQEHSSENGVLVEIPGTDVTLFFQNADGYSPPVWPEEPGKQQQMTHLDFFVDDLDDAVKRATGLRATKARQQFIPEIVVMLDSASHPFCLIPKGSAE